MDASVEQVVARAVAGETPTDEELLPLFDLPTHSAEAAHVKWGAEQIARRASNNTGVVYSQIGVDMLPCPMDCGFCTLARRNASADVLAADVEELIVPIDQIVTYARAFDQANVHLISLMATAALPFERYLEIVSAVRDAVQDDQVILANYGDMTLEQAKRLKSAGADLAYHAHRLGEGEVTRIAPERRLQTLTNIRDAGLGVMCGCEPLREGVPHDLILSRMHEALSFDPYCCGVSGLHAVPGTAMADEVPLSRIRLQLYGAIMRLLAGDKLPFGCGGLNSPWADAGTNPRGRDLPTDPDYLRRDVRRLRKELRGREWTVPDRPTYRSKQLS